MCRTGRESGFLTGAGIDISFDDMLGPGVHRRQEIPPVVSWRSGVSWRPSECRITQDRGVAERSGHVRQVLWDRPRRGADGAGHISLASPGWRSSFRENRVLRCPSRPTRSLICGRESLRLRVLCVRRLRMRHRRESWLSVTIEPAGAASIASSTPKIAGAWPGTRSARRDTSDASIAGRAPGSPNAARRG